MIEYYAKLTVQTQFFVDPNRHHKILFSNLVLISPFHKWPFFLTALYYPFLVWSQFDYF